MRGSYDFETYSDVPWEQQVIDEENTIMPLCSGLMWGSPGAREVDFIHEATSPEYVARQTLTRMLEISYEKDITDWWAHNGGKFDALILAKAAIDLQWTQSAVVAGSGRIVEWRFIPPRGKRHVVVCDTFALVPAKLKDAARDFELPSKKEFDADDYKGDMRRLDIARLRRGCLTDCAIVLELLERLETLFESWGGRLRRTFSSSALGIVKHNLASSGMELPSFEGRQEVNATCRQAFYGSRVEVFRHQPDEWLTEYDINSAYSHAMSQDLPWDYIGSATGIQAQKHFDNGEEGVYRAIVDVRLRDELPILPYKLPCVECEGREGTCNHMRPSQVFFPVGSWSGWFPGNELRYAAENGVSVKVTDAEIFTRASPFQKFIQEVYALKATAVGAQRVFTKYVLNGCYGKFGQKPEQQLIKAFPTEQVMMAYVWDNPGKVSIIHHAARICSVEQYRWPRHTHYAIASYITSGARLSLHRYLVQSVRPAYCDTDSIHCAVDGISNSACAQTLGALKVEVARCKGEYFAPKIYRLKDAAGKVHYASKGFPITCNACAAKEKKPPFCEACDKNFRQVAAGDILEVGRIRAARGQFRTDNYTPTRVKNKKVWKGYSVKRKVIDVDATVPWHVKELLNGSHIRQRSPLARGTEKAA